MTTGRINQVTIVCATAKTPWYAHGAMTARPFPVSKHPKHRHARVRRAGDGGRSRNNNDTAVAKLVAAAVD
jgi:hypothetical protein